ncbi:oxidoreductase [Limosilactobacillus frumenti DSM 13145]|uniref:Oxidoreductase n=1 Tax=Limosilactobacillus frumenti DSM 13145 TaxID=1423746 RepID=A0A0R1PH33_9LACO|nr:SDR family oxidoreductase [Limosilactobacillus frumenti]KRL27800.1 oxidoreductase [Limosilactobacillus frumenti DSM 13145]MBA2914434.1 SDR family oxidoreductase [Limosilactobacillus frumenti]QFG73354.1 SDR family oxidoreductase [Limosilactobacillus frumenti]
MTKYFITGATGHLGQKVVTELAKLTAPTNIRIGIHNVQKSQVFQDGGFELVHLDYNDVAGMVQAFTGVNVVIYIPSITYDVQGRINEFENSLTAMKHAGVANIVDVSFIADQANNPFQMAGYYAYLPARLASSGMNYAIVKNSLYADPLIPYLPELIDRHNVIYPVGDKALSFISRQDSAEAIANVAVKPYLRNHGQNYLLTMDQNYNMVELSHIMSQVTGKKIGYSPVTLQEFADIYRAEGDGDELSSMYHAGALGLMDQVTTDFRHITGHEPESMAAFLKHNYQK